MDKQPLQLLVGNKLPINIGTYNEFYELLLGLTPSDLAGVLTYEFWRRVKCFLAQSYLH